MIIFIIIIIITIMHSLHKGFYELPLSTSPQKVTLVFSFKFSMRTVILGCRATEEAFLHKSNVGVISLILRRVQQLTTRLACSLKGPCEHRAIGHYGTHIVRLHHTKCITCQHMRQSYQNLKNI